MTRLTTALTAAALAVGLTGCDTSPTGQLETATVPAAPYDVQTTVLHDDGTENRGPGYVAVLCVRGAAFLYVYADTGHYSGGPAISRFPEQDTTCPTPTTEARP